MHKGTKPIHSCQGANYLVFMDLESEGEDIDLAENFWAV